MNVQAEQKSLLDEIEAFLARHKMAPTTFGTKAVSDPGFVFGLREGRECFRNTQLRVRQFMEEFTP